MKRMKSRIRGVLVTALVIPSLVFASPALSNWASKMQRYVIQTFPFFGEEAIGGNVRTQALFEDEDCAVITQLPFVETFASDSETKPCWTVINNNEDGSTWDLNDTTTPYVGDQVAVMTTDGLDGENDDWMISPTITLTANQRLRYHYKVEASDEPNDFRVMLSTSGTAVENFEHELLPLQAYDNVTYKEQIIYLKDANGNFFDGDVTIAWHVPPGGVDGWRLYIDNVIVEDVPTCPAPVNIQLSTPTAVGVQVNWEQGYQEEQWEVVAQAEGSPMPTSGTSVDETSFTFTELNSNTVYDIYVRAICDGEEGTTHSDWTGPIRFRTNMIPVALPFTEDFEGETNFVFIGTKDNKWNIGTAVNNGGTHAMYISNDLGVTYQYTTDDDDWTSTQSYAYQDFDIEADVNELQLSFDWRCMGEGQFWPSDYFRVWAVSTDYQILPNEPIDEFADGVFPIGASDYKMNNTFANEVIFFDGTPFAGSTLRLVFEWTNDGSSGTQPPAAIDNIDLRRVLCSRPQNLNLISATATEFTVGWTAVTDVEDYELIIKTNPLPVAVDTDIPTHTAEGNSFVFTEVNQGSFYYVWLRTSCDEDTKSMWIGPLAVNIPKIPPVSLPYIEDFEGDVYFQTTTEEQHKWVTGNASSAFGSRSLYVTKDEGLTNTYYGEVSAAIHAFKDVIIPANSQELELSFTWKAYGETTIDWDTWDEIPSDYMRVWLVPASFTPTAGTLITPAANRIEIDPTNPFFQQRNFTQQRYIIPAAPWAGQNMRLVFEWIQNDYSERQPPAIVDNVAIKEYNCQDVENVQVIRIENTENFEVTWTPAAGQTKWEVFIIESGQPFPTLSDTGIVVEGDPSYIIENVPVGDFYKVFVRPICSDTNSGWWIGPVDYGIFYPSGCASISLEDIDLDISVDGEYIICSEDPYPIELKADYYDIKATTQYEVEQIDYDPPFPFFGGGAVDLTVDDYWSEIIDLGFDFCFFGNSYDKVLINTNGAISFSIEGEVADGRYEPNSGSSWSFEEELPFEAQGADAPFVNAIFGVMQDLNPDPTSGASPDDFSINYQIIGEYPCRALVFNIYHLGLYDQRYDPDDIEGSTQTSQIVLYEITNIIEVYVKNRPVIDPDAEFRHNDANGIIGIQNQDGTVAYVPPGRNTGDWVAQNEAWRFTPSGPSIASFEWLKNGEPFSTQTDIAVTIEESVTYSGVIKYAHCNGEDMVIKKDFAFLKEPMEFATPKTLFDCAKKPGSTFTYDLNENVPVVLAGLDSEEYEVAYYKSQADADADENELNATYETQTPNVDTIFMKITNKLTHCSKVISFTLGINEQLGATQIQPIFKCKEALLPALAAGEAYYTEPYGGGIKYEAGARYSEVGQHTLYVYKEDEKGCYGESTLSIEILPEVFAPIIEDKVFACEAFRLPILPEGTKYYTEPNEMGIELEPNYEVIVPMTIYMVTRNGNKDVYCYDESSFTVDFEDCPVPKGFSPNGDGLNDSFDLSNHGVAKIQIFNRNGTEVYAHGLGYTNQFVGKDKAGNQLPSGTYYYVIVSHGKLKTGWVQLSY
ncbi:choice-of-anchor J domain-containing protein [Myroides sp. DF42-4-2]|uniref:choice-of-anchor J domain-containing protein n=1 Tax=Myroides sp. DF42-4-2 TaxID=2746726 RepID=UPI002578A3D0|nr:choice-of-anchor J domain-containing protein [Myroides sp. DF42-4-2]MDM1408664.1 gliding motility-associated C-terminal domain-containing protein [Myroides sp. DF42-4-2]